MSPGGQMSPQSLPAGLKEHNQTVYLRVQVRDTLGVTTSTDMEVQVFPAESVDIEDQLHSIRFGNLSLLGKAVGKGDYQRAAQLISELSASMNNDDDEELEVNEGDSTTRIKDRLNQETKEIVREKMVATLSEVKVLTLELGRQMTSALTSAIAEPNEIQLETQENAVEIYANVLHKLKSEEDSAHDPDAANEISSNFLSGASSLLQAASIQSTKAAAELLTPESLIPPKEGLVYSERNQLTPPRALGFMEIKVLTEAILEMLELTGGLLVQTEVPGETPKMVHNSEWLMMAVQKVTILDDINRLYTMPDGSWLRLPAEAIDQVKDEARADNEIITQLKMYSFPTNPFTWHDDDIKILTTVVGLTLKNTKGKELHVSGLTEAIEVLLPRGEHSALKFDTMTAYSHELITVSFNVSEPSSSIHIDVYPADPEQTNRLEAYLRFGFWPTMNTYDIKTVLPIAESDLTVSSFNLTANFTANPYTWFIREEQLYATGSYYLSFRVVNDDAETNSTSLQVDVDVKIYTARCLFWSPSDELWLPDGCQVGTMTTASFTHCLCDHLSFVGGTFSVPPKQQIIFEEVVEVTLDPIKTNVVVFITLIISALSVICILFACIADCISRNKLYKDLEFCEDLYIVRTFTGLRCNAGSTAKISIILHGENNSSNPILLSNEDGRAFGSGSVDTFLAATLNGLGEIIKLSVSQNGQGFSPSWHFSRVVVKHHKSGREWMFLCNSQLKKPNTVLTFKAASTHQTVKHRHLFTTQSLLMTLSNQIPCLTVFMRYAWDPFSYKERVCTFFSALLLVPCLTTLFKDVLFAETPLTTNEFALHTDSVIHGGMIGGAVLVVYYVLGVLYSSIQPKLPTPPRSAKDHEAARDDNVNVKLKKVVKSSASLQDIIVEPKGIHLSLQGLGDDEEWDMGLLTQKNGIWDPRGY
nr:PKD1 polycystin 1 isoform 1 [Apostichopus japonicus]